MTIDYNSVPETYEGWLALAKKNPGDITEIYDMLDSFEDKIKLIKTGLIDFNQLDAWPNDNGIGVTLLHSAAEYRQKAIIQALLEAGADIRVRDQDGHTVLEALIWGHCSYDSNDWEEVLDIYEIMLPYNPELVISQTLMDCIQEEEDRWIGYSDSPDYRELIDSCEVEGN